MKKIVSACVLVLTLAYSESLHAEEAVTSFEEDWALNFFGYYYVGAFSPTEDTDYEADKTAAGLGLRYKNLSAQITVPLTFSAASIDFEANSYFDTIYYEAFFKRYKNLTHMETHENSGLDIVTSGIKVGWIHDHENHSLSSVLQLDKKQNVSGGSLLYGFGLFYSSLYSATGTIERYAERQHFLYGGPNIGYSYTWVFENGLFLNCAFNILPNWGITANGAESLFILQPESKIVFGYHAAAWSAHIKLAHISEIVWWDKDDNNDTLSWTTMALMFSKRL